MVADVEFQLEILPVGRFLPDQGELAFIQEDITGFGKVAHGQVETHGTVVQDLHGKFGGTNETQHAGIDHLPVHQDGAFLPLGEQGGTGGIGLGTRIDGQAIGRTGVEQNPGTLQGTFDPVEFPLVLRFQIDTSLLRTPRSGGISRRTEMKDHAVLRQHAA